uniref:DDE Tnp4 domain-containing protein n=1 Tax=Davidia involucrata TaxID=16924 RepID=A0A5B6Z293_DAVIN
MFTYVLPGWEGSTADGRVLRDALGRPDPLIVPNGKYYLVDAGYTNGPGFLAPYRGTRYHLNEWSASGNNPQTYKELFNLRHSTARNVIERAFGLLKKRWAILRSASFFELKTQVNIISACAILHNHIRIEQPNDPLLAEVEAELSTQPLGQNV